MLYFIALPIVAAAFVILLNTNTVLTFMLGMLAGVGIFGLLVIPTVAPDEIQRWRRGAEGEQSTAAQLEKLTALGWRSVHDRALKYSNVDHILVGPGGVFAIDTKTLGKQVEIVDGEVHSGGFPQHKMVKSVRGLAAQINSVIKTSTPHNVWVEGVLVFWADFPQNFAKGDRVTFVAGETLTPWIYSLERHLNREQIDSIVAAIEAMPDGVLLGAAGGS